MRVSALAAAALALVACSETPPAAEAAAPVGPNAWVVDKDASRLSFTATQLGTVFDGEFREFDASIEFDPADLGASQVEVVVDMTSATTGDRQRDSALPDADWFGVRDFPTARFTSSEIVAVGDAAYEARGALTIRDATRDLALPFTLTIDGERARAEGEVTLLRTDFGVGQGEFTTEELVGFAVEVSFVIEAERAGQ